MSNKSGPTQRQRSERARRVAMGIAVIQKPLKHVMNRTQRIVKDDKGRSTLVGNDFTKEAYIAASRGHGLMLKELARRVK